MYNLKNTKLNTAQAFCCCSIKNFIELIWMSNQYIMEKKL